jgi:hypothetical protein
MAELRAAIEESKKAMSMVAQTKALFDKASADLDSALASAHKAQENWSKLQDKAGETLKRLKLKWGIK